MEGEGGSNPFASGADEEERMLWRTRRGKHHTMDYKVEILMFEGQINPNDFLEWACMVKRVFE